MQRTALRFSSNRSSIAFLDRINISNANVYGMSEDLGLVSNEFNVALVIFVS